MIMPSAERLALKFKFYPGSVVYQPVVHFSDNLSSSGDILQYTKGQKGLICEIMSNVGIMSLKTHTLSRR